MTFKLKLAVICAAIALVPLASQAQGDARAPGVIQLMNQIEAMSADLNRLRGQLEVLNNALENAQRRQRDMYLDLDTRLRRLEQAAADAGAKGDAKSVADLDTRVKKLEQDASSEQKREPPLVELEARVRRLEQQAIAAATVGGPAMPAPTGAIAAPSPPVAPTVMRPTAPAAVPAPQVPSANETRRAYDSALALYRANDFQGAIVAFDAFIKRYPRDALAPNAQYWIGDSWFNLRDFRSAASAQQALITNYPDSPKLPDAMLNLSSTYSAMGDQAAARKTLEDLIARFPQSEAAERARQRLGRMKP